MTIAIQKEKETQIMNGKYDNIY